MTDTAKFRIKEEISTGRMPVEIYYLGQHIGRRRIKSETFHSNMCNRSVEVTLVDVRVDKRLDVDETLDDLMRISAPNAVCLFAINDMYNCIHFISPLYQRLKMTDAPQNAVADIAAGLAYLHLRGNVHANLQPYWLFVDEIGIVKIGGIFLMRIDSFISLRETRVEHAVDEGIAYLAPETYSDDYDLSMTADPALDVYAFGVITAELLLKTPPPFTAANAFMRVERMLRDGRPEDLTSLCPTAANLIKQCVNPNPGARPSMFDVMTCITQDQSAFQLAK